MPPPEDAPIGRCRRRRRSITNYEVKIRIKFSFKIVTTTTTTISDCGNDNTITKTINGTASAPDFEYLIIYAQRTPGGPVECLNGTGYVATYANFYQQLLDIAARKSYSNKLLLNEAFNKTCSPALYDRCRRKIRNAIIGIKARVITRSSTWTPVIMSKTATSSNANCAFD